DSGEVDGYILGSTDRGYDIYYGIVWGSRTSLDVAVKVVLTGTFIAVVIGAVSGYYGGRVDDIVMRITDVFIAIPGLVLALAIIAVTEDTSIEMLMYALIIVGWPGFTRIIRAEALRIRKLPYIEAAKASGASDFRIIFNHVIPNCITSVIVIATMDMGGIVLSLAALGFLGFGGGPDLAEWGKLVSFGQDNILLGQWWSFFFPGLVIALWALGFYLLGDGIRDILDPKQRN
ncbi:MAG: ABC transporter permease, partial [Candidatus Thermoplasmatota archaeon]|nr:ABC transporter permease [Candidatus Thermoplasmatota archaeon]